MKANKTSISLALTAALGTSGVALAADSNPFAMQSLDQGYMLAQADKAGEGKCGGQAKEKSNEGKCGGNKQKEMEKAGEGKCGGNK